MYLQHLVDETSGYVGVKVLILHMHLPLELVLCLVRCKKWHRLFTVPIAMLLNSNQAHDTTVLYLNDEHAESYVSEATDRYNEKVKIHSRCRLYLALND